MDVLSTVYGSQVLAEDAKTGDVVSSRREQLERGQGLNGEQAWLGMSVATFFGGWRWWEGVEEF